MPLAVARPVREEIVRRFLDGESLPAIAAALGLPYRTVGGIWRRFRDEGSAGLEIGYMRCGRSGPRFPMEVVEAALALKREHPRWGGGLIRLSLAGDFPEPLPRVRTLQEWFRAHGLQPPRARHPSAPRDRAREAHAVWQLDGKEGMRLQDGTPSVALTLVDEATGAALSAAIFPPQ